MFRQIVALLFIFVCTTIAWIILGSTILYRTNNSDEQLRGRVGSTWGTVQEQAPPSATYSKTEIVPSSVIENGKNIIRNYKHERPSPYPCSPAGSMSISNSITGKRACCGTAPTA